MTKEKTKFPETFSGSNCLKQSENAQFREFKAEKEKTLAILRQKFFKTSPPKFQEKMSRKTTSLAIFVAIWGQNFNLSCFAAKLDGLHRDQPLA